MQLAGFLALQCGFRGNRKGGAAAQHIKRFLALHRLSDLAPVECDCFGEILRQGADGLGQKAVFRPFGQDREAGNDGIDEGLGRGNRFFRSCLDIDRLIGRIAKRGGQGVDEGEGECATLAGALCQGNDVRAFTRLRHSEGCRPLQPQFRLVDGSERRAERGHRKAGLQFDRIFQKMCSVVGGAARNRDDNGRIAGLQLAAGLVEIIFRIVQQTGDGIGNLVDFLAHQGCHRFLSLVGVFIRRSSSVRRRGRRRRCDKGRGIFP